MLVADLFDLWRAARGLSFPTVELGLQIALIVALFSLRFGVRIPLSGHALLVTCFLFRRLWLGNVPPRQSRLEVLIAAGVLAAVAWPKLFWWDDPVTLLAGIGAAALLAAISGWAGTRLCLGVEVGFLGSACSVPQSRARRTRDRGDKVGDLNLQ